MVANHFRISSYFLWLNLKLICLLIIPFQVSELIFLEFACGYKPQWWYVIILFFSDALNTCHESSVRIEILLNFLCDVHPVTCFKCTAIWCLELEISNTLFLCFREIVSIIFNLIFFFIRVLWLVFVRVNQHISYKVFTWVELKLVHHVFGCAFVLSYNTCVFKVGWVAVAVEVIGIIAIITLES